jgi:DNA invertase Pin-like site-specific DNA recombinase
MASPISIPSSEALSGTFQGFALPKDAIYLRVSTRTQLERNSIETQRMKVAGRGVVGVEFVEQESGKKDNRPELKRAIAYVKGTGGILYVASLDRLSRRLRFLMELKDEVDKKNIRIQALDVEEFNTQTIAMWGMVAEMEWKAISRRNKDRAAAYIAKHGTNSGAVSMGKAVASKGGKLSGETRRRAIFDSTETDSVGAKYLRASGFVRTYLKAEPSCTLEQIAAALNLSGFVTATGSVFHSTSVVRLAKRFDIVLPKNKAGRKRKAA